MGPSKSVEFIIPAGPDGGADQMARMIQGIITKNNLMKQAVIPVNKGAGAGAKGFWAMKEAKGDPNKIIITLSNLFTRPLATGVPFNWQDITPVAMWRLINSLWDNTLKSLIRLQRSISMQLKLLAQVNSKWVELVQSKKTKLSL